MTYITEQTSTELRAHIRRLQKMPGWSDAVTDRLFKEIVEQDATIKQLQNAAIDALAGWKYIRLLHGDLYGVGWDRVQDALEKALSLSSQNSQTEAG